jgi:hypothetical protein
MRHNLVAACAIKAAQRQGLDEWEPRHGALTGAPHAHRPARPRSSLARMLSRIERIFAEWPCEQMPDAGELMLAGLGSPIFSLSRFTADPARINASCGSR